MVKDSLDSRPGALLRGISLLAICAVLFLSTGKCGADPYPSKRKTMDDVAAVVMSLKGGGSIVRAGTGVRSTMARGDVIFVGDQANLSIGAKLYLSFDPRGLDSIRFEGPCTITFSAPTQVEMSHGKASVMLENRNTLRLFKINTPGAVASARNAEFVVEIKEQGAEVRAHKSKVDVYGVNPMGAAKPPGVTVQAGQKASVSQIGESPIEDPVAMSAQESREMEPVQRETQRASEWMQSQPTHWIDDQIESENENEDKAVRESTTSAPPPIDSEKSKFLF